jgi:ketosteroid isomerase-like protein
MDAFADAAEGVRRTIAAYCHALDDGRTDDVVATFCPDAKVDIEGQGVFEGIDAIREAYAGWVPKLPQRHLVLNTDISPWEDGRLHAVSDLVFVLKAGRPGAGGDGTWAVQVVGRYDDMFRLDEATGRWLIHRRRARFG